MPFHNLIHQKDLIVWYFTVVSFILACIFIYLSFFRIKHLRIKRIIIVVEWLAYQVSLVGDEYLKNSLIDSGRIWKIIKPSINVSPIKYSLLIYNAPNSLVIKAFGLCFRLKRLLPAFYVKQQNTIVNDFRPDLSTLLSHEIIKFNSLALEILTGQKGSSSEPQPAGNLT